MAINKIARNTISQATRLHQLLEIALEDLKYAEAHPEEYQVDMAYLLEHDDNGCFGCLAGICASRRLGIAQDIEIPSELLPAMEALNELRVGKVSAALEKMGFNSTTKYDRKISPWSKRKAFWRDIRELLSVLKSQDL